MCEPSIASFQLHTAGESAYRDHAEDAAKVPAQRKYRPREAFRDKRLLLTARKRGSALQPRPARRDCGPCPAAPRARSRRRLRGRAPARKAGGRIRRRRFALVQQVVPPHEQSVDAPPTCVCVVPLARTGTKRLRTHARPEPHAHRVRGMRAVMNTRWWRTTAPILSRRISPQTAPNCADSRNGTPSSRAHHEAERLAIHAAIILGRDAAAGGGEGEACCGAAGGRAEDEMGKDERGRGLALDTDDGAGMESDMEGGPG
ncbi:hypothetical protein C8J57DRAFT_1245185 [Mycena rebaudengoi]|nr:hypothetical protein C8J57DRAFT_1245185 [Mycena rebaudengoi]